MTSKPIFEIFQGSLTDLFPIDAGYTFLVGTGISMDPPASIPSAIQIVKTLMNFCIPSDEIKSISDIDDLRFEYFIESIKTWIDDDLKNI